MKFNLKEAKNKKAEYLSFHPGTNNQKAEAQKILTEINEKFAKIWSSYIKPCQEKLRQVLTGYPEQIQFLVDRQIDEINELNEESAITEGALEKAILEYVIQQTQPSDEVKKFTKGPASNFNHLL